MRQSMSGVVRAISIIHNGMSVGRQVYPRRISIYHYMPFSTFSLAYWMGLLAFGCYFLCLFRNYSSCLRFKQQFFFWFCFTWNTRRCLFWITLLLLNHTFVWNNLILTFLKNWNIWDKYIWIKICNISAFLRVMSY